MLMTKVETRGAILKEIKKVNDRIDLRIISGKSYRDLQPLHSRLIAQLKTV